MNIIKKIKCQIAAKIAEWVTGGFPRFIVEAIVIIPFIYAVSMVMEGRNIFSCTKPAFWLFLYGFTLFFFRGVFRRQEGYGFSSIIFGPFGYIVLSLIVGAIAIQRGEKNSPYDYIVNPGEPVMAANCDQAAWNLDATFQNKQNGLQQDYQTYIYGNTETAKINAQSTIDLWLETHSGFKYIQHNLDLGYLPKDFVLKNKYPESYAKNSKGEWVHNVQEKYSD